MNNILVNRFSDIRGIDRLMMYSINEYNADDISTYIFNQNTVLKGSEQKQKDVLSNGKNPGLGIRILHQQGITGKKINAAIIDQNLLLNHPEFKGKIIEYYDTGCDIPEGSGSMHAPAVVSLFVGNNIGVAPDTKLYFAAVPSWKGDSKYYSDALLWIIDINRQLTSDKKIKVVSVSACPSGYDFYKYNQKMWDESVEAAQDEGILVLDCRNNHKTGFVAPCYYDFEDPDNVAKCKTGFPDNPFILQDWKIGVPSSFRTVAEEYEEGHPSYAYCGKGGLSWSIPYAAGVLCLGWQINPNLNKDEIISLLFKSCFINENGSKIINPIAFIDEVKKTL